MHTEALCVRGLYLVHDVLTADEEADIVHSLDAQQWDGHGIGINGELRRRTQQYGYMFSFQQRTIIGRGAPLPAYCGTLLERVRTATADGGLHEVLDKVPHLDLLIVNEYLCGQGIMPHIDALAQFGPVVVSVSLLSECVMAFDALATAADTANGPAHARIRLPRRSALLMSGPARYVYRHSISKDTVEYIDGMAITRDRRISLTFRRALSDTLPACEHSGQAANKHVVVQQHAA